LGLWPSARLLSLLAARLFKICNAALQVSDFTLEGFDVVRLYRKPTQGKTHGIFDGRELRALVRHDAALHVQCSGHPRDVRLNFLQDRYYGVTGFGHGRLIEKVAGEPLAETI
jgi:hypothetical protein